MQPLPGYDASKIINHDDSIQDYNLTDKQLNWLVVTIYLVSSIFFC